MSDAAAAATTDTSASGSASLRVYLLVRRAGTDPDGEPRFGMLETVREFGLAELDRVDEASGVRERLAAFHLDLAERASTGLEGPTTDAWMARLEAEIADLLATVRWLEEARRVDEAALVVAGLRAFFARSGRSTGAQARLEGWLARGLVSPSARNRVLFAVGRLASTRGDTEAARRALGELVSAERSGGDERGLRRALLMLGNTEAWDWNLGAARPLLEDGLSRALRADDRYAIGFAWLKLGETAYFGGDYGVAERFFRDLLDFGVRNRHIGQIGQAQEWLGALHYERGEDTQALAMLGEALGQTRLAAFHWGVGHVLAWLGVVRATVGDGEAAANLNESLRLQVESRDVFYRGLTLAGQSVLAARDAARSSSSDDAMRALELRDQATRTWETHKGVRPRRLVHDLDARLACLRRDGLLPHRSASG